MDDLRKHAKVPTFEVYSNPRIRVLRCAICKRACVDLHAHNLKYDDPAHVAAAVLGA